MNLYSNPQLILCVYNRNGRQQKWKATEMEGYRNGRRQKWKATEMEGDRNGRRQKWKATEMEQLKTK